jgi:hypothetical protein
MSAATSHHSYIFVGSSTAALERSARWEILEWLGALALSTTAREGDQTYMALELAESGTSNPTATSLVFAKLCAEWLPTWRLQFLRTALAGTGDGEVNTHWHLPQIDARTELVQPGSGHDRSGPREVMAYDLVG